MLCTKNCGLIASSENQDVNWWMRKSQWIQDVIPQWYQSSQEGSTAYPLLIHCLCTAYVLLMEAGDGLLKNSHCPKDPQAGSSPSRAFRPVTSSPHQSLGPWCQSWWWRQWTSMRSEISPAPVPRLLPLRSPCDGSNAKGRSSIIIDRSAAHASCMSTPGNWTRTKWRTVSDDSSREFVFTSLVVGQILPSRGYPCPCRSVSPVTPSSITRHENNRLDK